MAFSLTDFVKQLRNLENLLTEEFQQLSVELREEPAIPTEGQVKFRLVEQLQYHDILRQKLEHVRHFGEKMLAEGAQGPSGPPKELDCELVELSLALLRYTNMEYQEVSKRTYQLLFSYDRNTQLIPENPPFETEIQQLIKDLGNLYLEIEIPDEEEVEKGRSARYRKILDSFSMKTERDVFSMLFDEEASISSEEENDQEGQIELF